MAYATSKAALHEYARGLRNEYPWLRVTNFVVGPTMSDFANDWDQELAVAMFGRWSVEGYAAGLAMATEDMAEQIVRVLASGARVEEVHVMPDADRPRSAETAPAAPTQPPAADTIARARALRSDHTTGDAND